MGEAMRYSADDPQSEAPESFNPLSHAFPRAESRRRHLITEGALALAVGALTLPNPAALHPVPRFLLRAATAAVTGVTIWRALRTAPFEIRAQRQGIASIGAGLTLAGSEVSERLDAVVVRGIGNLGVPAPRLALAAVSSLAYFAAGVVDSDDGVDDEHESVEHQTDEIVELSERSRAIVRQMLRAVEGLDVSALLEQLAAARKVESPGEEEMNGWIEFAIPMDAPQQFPREFRLPVTLQLISAEGFSLAIAVHIVDGRLASVHTAPVDQNDHEAWEAPMPSLDALTEAVIVAEQPDGTTALQPLVLSSHQQVENDSN
ncbi:hypothetical protein [Humidisolicoccus flavus]|uniref:hypothetical protein n=1 Tax=Humidisolicoccus flavus TaxID=3111414 RepID=UPI00324F9492